MRSTTPWSTSRCPPSEAYFLAFGGLLLLFGRAADLLGRRRLFLAGVLLFAVASLVCGFAQEAWQLVAGRFAQGTGAAMASPAALALVSLLFPGELERAKAFTIWGSVAVLGGTSGLVISGALTGLASWRWIFFINLPIAAAALVLIPRLVAESRSPNPARMDIPGTVLGTGALVSVVYGLLNAADAGWGATASIAPLLLASVLVALFLLVEANTTQPLVPMSFLFMLHLQTVLGYQPLAAGLGFLPYAGGILAGVTVSPRLVSRLGPRWALVASFLISALGLLLLSGVSPTDSYLADVLPGMIIASFGGGIGFPALTVAALSGTTDEDAGVGSAVLKAVQQVGGAVGLAILVNLATRRSESVGGGSPAAFTEGLSLAFTVAAAVLALGALAVATLMPTGAQAAGSPTSAGLSRRVPGGSEGDGDLAARLSGYQVAHRLRGFRQRERAVDAGRDVAGLDEVGEPFEVGAAFLVGKEGQPLADERRQRHRP